MKQTDESTAIDLADPEESTAIARMIETLKKIPPRVFKSPEHEAAVLAAISADEEKRREKQDLDVIKRLARERAAEVQASFDELPAILTLEAIEYFFEVKSSGFSEATEKSYRKILNRFARTYTTLPLEEDVLQHYASLLKGKPKYRLSHRDLLTGFYNTIKHHYRLPHNPAEGLERPRPTTSPPNPLSLNQVTALMKAVETDTEMVTCLLQPGAGWRPVEVRRIQAIDVRQALCREHPIILCRGKERPERTPLLPEALPLLSELTPATLRDDEPIMRSRRIRGGVAQPMGEKAQSTLVYGMYRRAGIEGFVQYDLRDTFATLASDAGADYFLVERLLRHILPGEGKRYIRFSMAQLSDDLQRYSAIRLARAGEFDSPPSPPSSSNKPQIDFTGSLTTSPGA